MRKEAADMTEEDATSQAARDEDGERLEEELDEYRGGSRRSCPSLGGGQRTR
jgi:hypothetical protein